MVITVTGDNRHQVKTEVQRIMADFAQQHGDLAVERFDAAETEAEHTLSVVQATSLFNPEKLIYIEDFEANKALVEATETLLASTPDETTILISIGKLDKRAAYGKLLKKQTDFREFTTLSPGETIGWVQQTVKEKGGTIDRPAAQQLVDYVGTDQARLENEIDKLLLFDTAITRKTIDELVERQPSSTVFELLDAGFNGHQQRALQLYDEQRRLQMEPLAIIGMIGWQLHILAVIKTAKGKAAADIAKDAGIHPFVVQKSTKLAAAMPLAKLRQLVHRAVELEVELKSRAMHADDAVKHYILTLTTS